jgi:hypothetical protein
MRIAETKPLFAWDCLEDGPSLKAIRALLAAIPDGVLLDSLRGARGKGRNDYPSPGLARLPISGGSRRKAAKAKH